MNVPFLSGKGKAYDVASCLSCLFYLGEKRHVNLALCLSCPPEWLSKPDPGASSESQFVTILRKKGEKKEKKNSVIEN